MVVGAGATIVLVALGVFATGLSATNRAGAVLLGLVAAWLTWWIFRRRKWRLAIFPDGVVQVRPGGVDELRWAEVREAIRTRMKGLGDRTTAVTLVGASCRMVVCPINYRAQAKLFDRLLAAAERRGVPVRVEWVEVED